MFENHFESGSLECFDFIFELRVDLRYSDVGELLPGKVKMSLGIFTHNGFLVVASNVVPFDT